MAGMILCVARSPVTPKRTRLHGPAILGRRLSFGLRSGFLPSATRAGFIRTRCRGQYWRQLGKARVMVGQVQPQDGAPAVSQHLSVTAGLGRDEVAEGEVPPRDGQVALRCGRDLQVHTGGRTALVILTGRVEEAWSPPERCGGLAAVGDGPASASQSGVSEPVEIGHDRHVAVARVQLREQRVDGAGKAVGVPEPTAAKGAHLNGTVNEGGGIWAGGHPLQPFLKQSAGGLLCTFDIGLVERVDSQDVAATAVAASHSRS